MMYYCNSDKEPEKLKYYELKTIKVCNGYDSLSKFNYHKLIDDNKHLKFFNKIKNYQDKDKGVIIRWLYRGLSLQQSIDKMDQEIQRREKFINRWKKLENNIVCY